MTYKESALEFLGIKRWHELGYTGKGIKIMSDEKVCKKAHPDVISPSGFNSKKGHGDSVMAHIKLAAPDAELIAYPMSGQFSSKSYKSGCIDYIINNDVDIFTTSSLGDMSEGRKHAIQDCKNCIFFAAAGNDGEKGISREAKSEVYYAIGGVKPTFTNRYGSDGDPIYDWGNLYRVNYSSVGEELDYVTLAETMGAAGTSFCAPLFAAQVALVQQFFKEKANRKLTKNELEHFILDYTYDLEEEGHDKYTGRGIFRLPEPDDISILEYIEEIEVGTSIDYTGIPEVLDGDDENVLTIKENLTIANYKKEPNAKKYIVIHYTANDGDTAYSNTQYFKSEYRGASAHYFVDEKKIYRCVEDDYIAWHCGALQYKHKDCRNSNSIGIEMCSRKDSNGTYYIKEDTVGNAVWLTKQLMAKYNIPAENVIRHYDVTGKNCPEPFVREPKLWENFKERLVEEVRYKTVEEMPEWAREPIQDLIDKGILSGRGGEAGLDLTDDMVRSAIVCKKMMEKMIEEMIENLRNSK